MALCGPTFWDCHLPMGHIVTLIGLAFWDDSHFGYITKFIKKNLGKIPLLF
jgi:hypothetical protein